MRRLHTPIASHSAGLTTPAVCRTRIAGRSARPTPQSVDHRMPRPQVRARLYTGRPAEPRPQQAAVAPRRPAELCPNKATHAKALHIITSLPSFRNNGSLKHLNIVRGSIKPRDQNGENNSHKPAIYTHSLYTYIPIIHYSHSRSASNILCRHHEHNTLR